MDFLIIATWRLTWSHHTAATTLTAADFLMIDQHFPFSTQLLLALFLLLLQNGTKFG